jgi:hypothetical protein
MGDLDMASVFGSIDQSFLKHTSKNWFEISDKLA